MMKQRLENADDDLMNGFERFCVKEIAERDEPANRGGIVGQVQEGCGVQMLRQAQR